MSNDQEELTTAEAADILGLDRSGITRRVQSGELQPSRKLPGRTGSFLFRASDIEALRERAA